MIPQCAELVKEIIQHQHNAPLAGHGGRNRTLELIARTYWWPTMRKDIEAYVSTCDLCQRNKARTGKQAGELAPLPEPDVPWDSVGVDFVNGLPPTKDGYDAIVVFIDRCTKMVHVAPTITNPTAEATANLFLYNVTRYHGVPRDVISDRGVQFASRFWQAYCKLIGMESKLSSAFHPQTDGQTERANRVVIDTLRNYCDETQTEWADHLPMVEFALNNASSSATQMSPFYANYGFHPRTPAMRLVDNTVPGARHAAETLDSRMQRAKRCVQAAHERMKAHYDKSRKPLTFERGQRVLLSTRNLSRRTSVHGATGTATKLWPRYIGPYEVLERIGEQAYRLKLPDEFRIHNVFHVSLLQPYNDDGTYHSPPPVDWWDGQPVWRVDRILDHEVLNPRARHKKYKYFVRWEGYGPGDDSWEPENHFTDNAAIDEYWTKLGQPKP
jgi:hypothetical protein